MGWLCRIGNEGARDTEGREWEIQRGSGRYRDGARDTEREWEIKRWSGRYREGVGDTEME